MASTTGPLDTVGALLDGNCGVLAEDDDSGSVYNFRFTTRVLPAGTYYLVLYEWEGDFGTYTLTTNFTPGRLQQPDIDGNTSAIICSNLVIGRAQEFRTLRITTADVRGHLTLGTDLSARFNDANEVHLYRITLTGSGNLTVFTTGSLDTVGALLDGNCGILAEDDDSGSFLNFRFATRALPVGTYYLVLYEYNGDFGTYTLTTDFTSDRPQRPDTDAMTDYRRRVTAMYVAYYGRPGDAGGIEFWAQRLNEVNGDLSEIVDAFGNSEEYRDRFGDLDPQELVNNIFVQLLGRDADPEGLTFYSNGFRSGEFSLASIALNIFDGASGRDLDTIDNKLSIADAFTSAYVEAGARYGEFQIRDAFLWLAEVDNTDASVTAARQRLPSLIDTFPTAAD